MANSFFQFKQFLIHQDRCAMKLGTDAVMLGALANYSGPKTILDVGMGTGVIGLMLAQRYPSAQVHGVEIEEGAYLQASQNIIASPWQKRVAVFHSSFQNFAQSCLLKYDMIVSNPPYYSNHLKSPQPKKNLAMHDDQLSLKELLQGVNRVISDNGLFWLILPVREMNHFKTMARVSAFNLHYRYLIRDQPFIEPHREICAYGKENFNNKVYGDIHLKEESGQYSQIYRKLVKNFLLNH